MFATISAPHQYGAIARQHLDEYSDSGRPFHNMPTSHAPINAGNIALSVGGHP